jgi:G3E family GTPase
MKDIPVFIVLGFLDSGKTTFILDCLKDERMNPPQSNSLIIACEDGEVEYDEKELAALMEDYTG